MDYVYLVCKVGDLLLKPICKQSMSWFDGMIIDYIDPLKTSSKSVNIPAESKQAQAFAHLKVPRSWLPNIKRMIESYEPTFDVKNNLSASKNHRKRLGFVDYKELESLTKISGLEQRLRAKDVATPVIDCMHLTTSIFKDSCKKDFLHLSRVKDFNSVSSGTYTFGDVGAGDDYASRVACEADWAHCTGDITFQQNHSNDEAAQALWDRNLNGYTFTLTNNSPSEGDVYQGNISNANHIGNTDNLQMEGPGIVVIEKQNYQRDVAPSADTVCYNRLHGVITAFTAKIRNNIYNGCDYDFMGIRQTDGSPILHIYTNIFFSHERGITYGTPNSNNVIENCAAWDMANSFIDAGSTSGGICRNCVAFENDGVPTHYQFEEVDNMEGYGNVSDDGSGADDDWSVGSDNQPNLTRADQWQSGNPLDGALFAKPVNGSDVALDGVTPTYVSELIDNITWSSEIGPKGKSSGALLRRRRSF